MFCVETSDLFHKYSGEDLVLNKVGLKVPEGSIYGFLGPNGAGKTTTLKLILGLLKKQQGEILVFGKHFEKHRIEILEKTGSLIESPSLYGHLTAVENLALLNKIYRRPNKRIQEVLNMVGLAGTGTKRASQFSFGMKQRLGIAIALLNDPALLILDEPSNGLDPHGMVDLRELLTGLNEQSGTSIIISSHLLTEIEKLVSHIGVISKGKLLFQGTLGELRNKQAEALSVAIATGDIEKTVTIVKNNNLTFYIEDDRVVLSSVSRHIAASINRQLIMNDIEVFEVSIVKNDLETIFMNLITN